MEDTSKYLIHADVTANGVVERNDVVGAIFGQTEGLLGDELDLRDLRRSQKVGRIDVEVASTAGQSHGHLTIATNLDKVETATLAAALETIDRVGPCRADLEVTEIEDVRAAKRKEVVERATELLRTGFDDSVMTSEEILAEVRQQVRVEDVTSYEGLPAGPRVADSDAIIVVEGRADVLTLLKYGIKNAIAVEGTDVPDAVAELTRHRTVTAFLDGDRGGDLILEELSQVGDVDYVAFAPSGTAVEDLDHHELFAALRNKAPYETVAELNDPRKAIAATDGSATPAPEPAEDTPPETDRDGDDDDASPTADDAPVSSAGPASPSVPVPDASGTGRSEPGSADVDASTQPDTRTAIEPEPGPSETVDDGTDGSSTPGTVYGHATDVVREETDRVRFLDADGDVIDEGEASEAYELLERLETPPSTIVLDEILGQRLLDLAASRDVGRIVARSLGQFTKRPTGVRIHAIDDVAEEPPV